MLTMLAVADAQLPAHQVDEVYLNNYIVGLNTYNYSTVIVDSQHEEIEDSHSPGTIMTD